MPCHNPSPISVTPRRQLSLVPSHQEDLFASLNATLSSKDSQLLTPIRNIQLNDYTVPAPPPPSPVSFRVDQWPSSLRR